MAIHYFHCTDGHDLIVDRSGSDAASDGAASAMARQVADEVMRAVPAHDAWEGWAVHVYDAFGVLDIVPFVQTVRLAALPPGMLLS